MNQEEQKQIREMSMGEVIRKYSNKLIAGEIKEKQYHAIIRYRETFGGEDVKG